MTKGHTILTSSRHRYVRDAVQPLSNTSNTSAHTSANLDHHWEADIDGPKDDKDDTTAFRKFSVATLSIVYHDSRQLNIIPLFISVKAIGGGQGQKNHVGLI